MSDVSIDWEVVTDGLTPQGAGFEQQVRNQLGAGDVVTVNLPDGGTKTFTDPSEFSDWFRGLTQQP